MIVSGREHCGDILNLLGSGRDMGVRLSYEIQDDLELSSFTAQGDRQAKSTIRLQNTRQAFIHGCQIIGDASNFITIEGDKSDNITLSSNDVGSAKNIYETANGAKESSIRNI